MNVEECRMDAQVHIPGRLLARCVWLLVPLVCLSAVPVAAGEDEAANAVPRDVRTAIKRALPLLEVGSAGAADQRTCFTCHSQAVPLLALAEARRRGFRVDADNFQRQVDHTAEHLRRGAARYRQGKGQGGQVVTAGYALWALAAANFKGDATTTAVTHYLLEYQKDRPHWRLVSRRPPSSGSDFTATALALRGLRR